MTLSEARGKLLYWWREQLGYTEGVNNWNKYAESADLQRLYGWYPQNQPWCDMIYDAGMIEVFGLQNASRLTYQPIGQGSAACKYSAAFYSTHNALKDTPEPCDQIFFYDGKGEINHTGIVESVENGVVHTIEGNTSDKVMRRQYPLGSSKIAGYGRPAWKYVIGDALTPAKPTIIDPAPTEKYCVASIKLPIINYGDKGEYVKLMQQRLMLVTDDKGNHPYNCGWYGADGDYGQLTKNSLIKFQKDNSLEADGVCGQLTWVALLGVK